MYIYTKLLAAVRNRVHSRFRIRYQWYFRCIPDSQIIQNWCKIGPNINSPDLKNIVHGLKKKWLLKGIAVKLQRMMFSDKIRPRY